MTLTITQSALKNALAAVAAAVPAKATIPVLANLLIEATEAGVTITATNLDMAVIVTVQAQGDWVGAVTVPAKKFADFVRELGDGPVVLSVAKGRLTARQGKSTMVLNTLPADEFPALPVIDGAGAWTIAGAALQGLIADTAFAAATDESRPILAGVLWQWSGDEMRMVATDGHRLARRIEPVAAGSATRTAGEMIVPPKALAQVKRLMRADTDVTVSTNGSFARFVQPGIAVITRLIEGPYPNYEQVIPKGATKLMTVDRAAFERVLRQMGVVASDQTRRMKLEVAGQTARFSVQTPDLGEADAEMTVAYEGEPIAIGFNVGYLLEVLANMTSTQVVLSFSAPERAVTIVPVAETVGDAMPRYLALVMPLRLTA
jgi:DNA polymerase-3 subunit beta